MPWHVIKSANKCPVNKPWAVVKNTDGSVVPGGCHESAAQARDHAAALYANVKEMGEDVDTQLVDFVEIYEDADGKWRWRAKSNNGDIVADSGQGYEQKMFAETMAGGLFSGVEIIYPGAIIDHTDE